MAKTKKQTVFEKKSFIAVFGIIALLAGFYFLNFGAGFNVVTGKVTGNSVNLDETPVVVNLISAIGLILIVCAAILIVYAIVRRE